MNAEKKARLEAAGYKFTTTTNWLDLTPEDEAEIESRLATDRARRALAALVKESRGPMTQTELAKRIKTTQPRIAKIESASPNVSIEQLMRAAIGAGADLKRIGKALVKAAG
jgi:hypothetical protein